MGSRGQSSASSSNTAIESLSDTQIQSRIKQAKSKMETLGATMEKYANVSIGYLNNVPGATKSEHEKYVNARDEYQKISYQRNLLETEMAKRVQAKAPASTEHVFVNSFGEATKRYITSTTYERAQKRLDREIQSRLEGRLRDLPPVVYKNRRG